MNKVAGVILSGGKSLRMGTNKALLKIQGKPVIERILAELGGITDEVMIVANHPNIYQYLDISQVADRYLEKGPLAGLETALYHGDGEIFMFAACDMPFINGDVYQYLFQQLNQYDAVVPIYDNHMHPLAGIYKKSILPAIQAQIEKNNLRVKSFFGNIHVNYVSDFAGIDDALLQRHFFNMNHPAQYEEAKLL